MVRPFRFGMTFTGSTDARRWGELARRLESEGFSTLSVADHYLNEMACGPLLVAAANATTTLRVGSFVYDNDFRHPALLAKEAATIDVLSGGRLELGVGAGYNKEEYEQVGLPFDPPGVRVGRLEESVEIMTRLFKGEDVTYEGQHYRLNGFEGAPLPIQRPIPLLIGGGGPRMIRLAARKAQIMGFVPKTLPGGGVDTSAFTAAVMDAMVAALEEALAEAGRDDDGPERNMLLMQMHGSADEATDDDWMPPEVVGKSPFALVGEPAAMVEALHERRERWGLSYFVCFESDLERFIPVVRLLAS